MAQFITATEFKTYLGLDTTNFNSDLVKTYIIEIAQQEHIRPVIGQDLYDELVTQNDASTLTAVNTTLMGYIKPALAYYTMFELFPYILVDIKNTGFMINNTEYSLTADVDRQSLLRTEILKHAGALKNKMLRYLNDDDQSGVYPLYTGDGTSGVSFYGGWIISK